VAQAEGSEKKRRGWRVGCLDCGLLGEGAFIVSRREKGCRDGLGGLRAAILKHGAFA
jgi:hypothetical protein